MVQKGNDTRTVGRRNPAPDAVQRDEGELREVAASEEFLEALVAEQRIDASRFDQAPRLRCVLGNEVGAPPAA